MLDGGNYREKAGEELDRRSHRAPEPGPACFIQEAIQNHHPQGSGRNAQPAEQSKDDLHGDGFIWSFPGQFALDIDVVDAGHQKQNQQAGQNADHCQGSP